MPHIYPVGGGKGGVGKSFITANLGVLFAKHGKRVVLVDLDLGGSNLHTFLEIKHPKTGLHDYLNKKFNELDHAVSSTSIPNLFILCSNNCSFDIANLFHSQKLKIIKAIQKLPYDYVLLDLGSGTNFNTLDFFLTSNEGIFIFTTEPTSIENTLSFIKAVYYRKLKQVLKQQAFNSIVKKLIDRSKNSTIQLPDIIEFIIEQYPEKGKSLQAKLSGYKFSFVLNEFRKQVNPDLGEKIEKVCNRHFYSDFQFLGNVSYDDRVYDSVFSKKIYIQRYPYTPTATDLENIFKKMTENSQYSVSALPQLS
jgi:flagellar biosynthesis protein FlhG